MPYDYLLIAKCVEQYAKINLLSEKVDGLREREAGGQGWLEETRSMFKHAAIQMSTLHALGMHSACTQHALSMHSGSTLDAFRSSASLETHP